MWWSQMPGNAANATEVKKWKQKRDAKDRTIHSKTSFQWPHPSFPPAHSPIRCESIGEHIAEVRVTFPMPHFRRLLHWRPSSQHRVEDPCMKSQSSPRKTFVMQFLPTDRVSSGGILLNPIFIHKQIDQSCSGHGKTNKMKLKKINLDCNK